MVVVVGIIIIIITINAIIAIITIVTPPLIYDCRRMFIGSSCQSALFRKLVLRVRWDPEAEKSYLANRRCAVPSELHTPKIN